MKCISLAITMEYTISGIVLLLDSNRKLICLHFVHVCQIVMWIWQKYSVNANWWIQSHNNQSEQQEDGTKRRLNMPITNFISVFLLDKKIMCKMQHSNNKYNKWTIIYIYSFDLRALSGVKNDVDIDNTIFLTQQATSLICNGSATHILMEWNRSSCVSCSWLY